MYNSLCCPCAAPAGCGSVCVPVANFCTGAPELGAAVTVQSGTTTVGTCTTTGQLNAVTMTNGPTNGPYTNTPPPVTFTGDGAGATGTAILNGGAIDLTIAVTAGGSYATRPTVSFSNGGTVVGGTNATATATMGLDSATPAAGGSGYTVGDVLTISGGTSTLTAQVTVSAVAGGAITAVSVSRAGSYTALPTSPAAVTGGTGTGATFTALWRVIAVPRAAAGTLYYNPTVTFAGGGGTGGAAATATASAIRVGGVTIGSRGDNYTTIAVTIGAPPAGGVTALATATLRAQCCAPITAGGNLTVTATKGGRTASTTLLSVPCTGSSVTTSAATLKPYKTIATLYGTLSGGILPGPVTIAIPFTGTQASPKWAGTVNIDLPSGVVQCPGHGSGAGTVALSLQFSCTGTNAFAVTIGLGMNWLNTNPPAGWTQPTSGTIGNAAICFSDAANACPPEDQNNGSLLSLGTQENWSAQFSRNGGQNTTILTTLDPTTLFAATSDTSGLEILSCIRVDSTTSQQNGFVAAVNLVYVPFDTIHWSE